MFSTSIFADKIVKHKFFVDKTGTPWMLTSINLLTLSRAVQPTSCGETS
jgi:hypothetical protein